jgi:arsenate reductase (thioredoxin)
MAEGWTRHLRADSIEPYSAGIQPKGLDLCAVKVMAESGVDISGQRSKHLSESKGMTFDVVITVCDSANESCPIFPGITKRIHKSFDDPPKLAESAKTEEEALAPYRRVRDEIRAFVEAMPDNLSET